MVLCEVFLRRETGSAEGNASTETIMETEMQRAERLSADNLLQCQTGELF